MRASSLTESREEIQGETVSTVCQKKKKIARNRGEPVIGIMKKKLVNYRKKLGIVFLSFHAEYNSEKKRELRVK